MESVFFSVRQFFWGVILLALSCVGIAQEGRGDVIYVPTPQIVVDTMLEMAAIGPNDYLIDLGSGDGRIVITAAAKYGASGFGVDLDTYLLGLVNANAKIAKVDQRVHFREENLFLTDLSRATVISTYLLPEMNVKLRPKLMAMPPGTRIVAHDYHLGKWLPEEQRELVVPDKVVGKEGISYVFLYIVPVPIAGLWEGAAVVGGRDLALKFDFQQDFQELIGKLDLSNRTVDIRGHIKGRGVRILAGGRNGVLRHEFHGQIGDGVMQGTVVIGEGASRQESTWRAQLKQARPLLRAADEVSP